MEITTSDTPIAGMVVLTIPVHGDARGWFKENWQREKMVAAGLPDFGPVQNNVAFNASRGATRGLHAEPWDKLVSVATGRVFAAWVDLREGPGFGTTHHLEVGPETVVFVPRGVANGYQSLADGTAYVYLVNDHWRPDAAYPAVDLADPALGIPWPIPPVEAELSEKDRHNPALDRVVPMPPRRTLVLGAGGQLGRALAAAWPGADLVDAGTLDVTDDAAMSAWPWGEYDVVLNATGYTAVDAAEQAANRVRCWAVNATAPARLGRLARQHRFQLVHYSTDYVFDGSRQEHVEDEPVAPLGVYGQSKAAGELAAATAPAHYVVRTSWLVGDGVNFVRTMADLAARSVSPRVVCDQVGRLTFTETLAAATRHLLDSGAPFGTYHCSNSGEPMSWAQIAARVFELCGRDPADVVPVSTADYYAGQADRLVAPRPHHSALDLGKLRATGFEPEDAMAALKRYLTD